MSQNNMKVWNRYAPFYDLEIRLANGKAYKEMYRLMAEVLTNDMEVLEVATGTGLIGIHIAPFVRRVEAIDFSPKMIAVAKRKRAPKNIRFFEADAKNLPFADHSFDGVIISNALHIMSEPEKALENIRRVLKPGGVLIAPSFSHGHISEASWNANVALLRKIGFEAYSKWTPQEYVKFLENNGFHVLRWQVLKAGFPLVYAEAKAVE